MPLIVRAPESPIVASWRAPIWQRVLFPGVGLFMLIGAIWPYAGEPYEPIWLGIALGTWLMLYALRPKLTLHEDSVHIRGQILSRVIPIEEISAVDGGYGGLNIWWGDGRATEASAIGEQTNVPGLPGSDGRRHDMKELILQTRDTYLQTHGLRTRPDPHEEYERRRRDFEERGWVEHNPPLTRDARKDGPS